jgi:hypothetical protein
MSDKLILMFIILAIVSITGSITIKDLTVFGVLKLKELNLICKSFFMLVYAGEPIKLKKKPGLPRYSYYYRNGKLVKRIVKNKENSID